jgi:choline dehydrogenase-like flavoprotein
MDGVRRVLANTWGADVFRRPEDLARLREMVRDPRYVTLGTGHPQGGLTLGARDRRGVVGPDFRVHGVENLYVCDASVFPTSVGVNPQVTVMGLAHYAGQRID